MQLENVFQRKHILIKLALSVVSICMFLVITELILRKIIPLDDGTSYEFRVPHPDLGWVLEPDASYHNTLRREDIVFVKYNSLGWHDVEHTVEKPEGAFRILVLGDSFLEAYSVNLNDSFPRHLETLTRMRGYNTEVINFGVDGYGTLQEYLAFQKMGKQYAPDLVLLGFFISDDVMNNSAEIESITSKERNRPFLNPDHAPSWELTRFDYAGAKLRYDEAKAQFITITNNLINTSVLLNRASKEFRRIIFKLYWSRKNKPEPIDKALKDMAVFGVHYCVEPPQYTRAWETTRRILSRLKSDVEAHNGRLVVFTVPSFGEISLPYMQLESANARNTGELCLEESPGYKRLQNILTDLRIDFVDLLPDFRRVMQAEGVNLFRNSNYHWNREGHFLAARSVTTALINRRLLR